MRKEVIKIFKEIGFKIEIKPNLKVVEFLDIIFNLSNGTYKPYTKPKEKLLHVNASSNHPPHPKKYIKQIPISIAKRLSKNLSSIEIFNSVKVEYENALERCRYHSVKLNCTQKRENKPKHNRSQNIIWFNPPYSQNVITNVAKRFLNFLDHHFPKSNKLPKIFNRNAVKVTAPLQKISPALSAHTTRIN